MPMPEISRRAFGLGALSAAGATVLPRTSFATDAPLRSIVDDATPIAGEERLQRIAKAQAEFDQIHASAAQKRAVEPDV